MAQRITSTGSLAALNATVDLDVTDCNLAAIMLDGTATMTVTFLVSDTASGGTFYPVGAPPKVSARGVASVSASGATSDATAINVEQWRRLRAQVTAYTSGSLTVKMLGLVPDELG